MEYLENEFSGFENSFLRETVENIISYGLENKNSSLDEFCYFLSDMLPEVEFKNVALFMDDEYLTEQGKKLKREKDQELTDSLQEGAWLFDLIKAAHSVSEQSRLDAFSGVRNSSVDEPQFNLNAIVSDKEGHRARVLAYEPETNKYQLLFVDPKYAAKDGWYSPECLQDVKHKNNNFVRE